MVQSAARRRVQPKHPTCPGPRFPAVCGVAVGSGSPTARRGSCRSRADSGTRYEARDDARSAAALPHPVRVRRRLSLPAPGVHDRARVLHRGAGRAAPRHREARIPPDLVVLDQDLCGLVRDGRRVGNRDAVPVRYQLEPLFRCHGERDRAAHGVRGPHRVLPRGGVPRRAALRPQAGPAVGALRRRGDGRARDALQHLLDPHRQQLDADAGRLRDRRRPVRPDRLACGDVEPVVPVPVHAHRRRGLSDDRLHRDRPRRVVSPSRALCPGGEDHDRDGGRARRGAGARPGAPRRRARAQHARAPAAEARRDGGNLGDAGRAARGAVRAAGRSSGGESRRGVDPEPREPLPDLRLERGGQGTEGFSAGRAAAGSAGVLRLSRHGRDVGGDVRAHGLGLLARLAQAALHDAGVPARVDVGDPGRLHRGDRRLDHDRGRAAAVRRVRPPAHRRCGDAQPYRRRCADVVDRLHRRLPDRVRSRAVLPGPAGAARPARASRQRARRSATSARPAPLSAATGDAADGP